MTNSHRMGHKLDMMHDLERLQDDLELNWLDQSLPERWSGLEWDFPVEHHKTRVTLRVDTDMLKWFRKMGPGYQGRINRVLRIYWTSLLCGHIQAYRGDNTTPRLQLEVQRAVDAMKEDMRHSREARENRE